jgi:hypothetical protein
MTGKCAGKLSIALIVALIMPMVAPALAAATTPAKPIHISSFTDRAGSVNIDAGKAEGIVVGAKGNVIRDGKVIAEYTVAQVNWGISRILLSNVAEGYTVRVGDSAPLIAAPTTAASAQAPKKKSKSTWKWAAAAVGALAVILLAKGKGGGSSTSAYGISLEATKVTTFGDTDKSTVTITATIRDSKGGIPTDGTPVTFSTTAGELDRTSGATSNGKCSFTVTGKTSDGSATVTVNAIGKTATINVSFISSISLEASPTKIQVVNSGGSAMKSVITATCKDAQGNPATSGNVKFTTTVGTIDETVPISNGVAKADLTSTQAGNAEVTASWLGTTAKTNVTITTGPPYAVSVSSTANTVQCDGNSFVTITATVTDVAGNRVADGTVVKFSVAPDGNGGGNGSITPQANTSNGEAKANLFTKTAAGVKSKSGTATVTVKVLVADQPSTVPPPAADIVNSLTKIVFASVDVSSITLSAAADSTRIAGWGTDSKATITAVVKSSDGNTIDGVLVTFSPNHGRLTPSSSTTASGGTATTSLSPDGSSYYGPISVTATAGGVTVTQPGVVTFVGPPSASQCKATISPSATLAKSNDSATITVEAKDTNGNPVLDDTSVSASTSKGTIEPTSSKTSNGIAIFTLKTSSDSANPTASGAGQATVTVSSGGGSVTLKVDFTVKD